MQNPQNPYGDPPPPPRGSTPSMVSMPSVVPPASLRMSSELASYKGRRETAGVFSGIFLAVTIHALVVGASVRLGKDEGNVAARNAPEAQENRVIETQLLRRGGGEMDPRHIVHREAPVLAEREAPRQININHDPTQVVLPRDAGAEDYMGAITGRRVAARGNQDLAERMRQMAAAEQTNPDPTAQGPGDPTGSNVGTTTDPNQASAGAIAKAQEFFMTHVHSTQGLCNLVPDSATMTVRVRVNADGSISRVTMGRTSGNETLDADLLGQAQGLAESHAQISNLTPEESALLVSHAINLQIHAGCGH